MSNQSEQTFVISNDGDVVTIYDDNLAELYDQGKVSIKRASHVEPDGTKWYADLEPVGGPLLGPFSTRGQALFEEVSYLNANLDNLMLASLDLFLVQK